MASPATFAPPLSPEDLAALRYRPGGPLSYLQGNPGVPPGGASFGQQFQPDDGGPDASAWLYGGPPDPAAFKPQVGSSGPGGQGLSAQPQAPQADPSSQGGAAKVLGGRMPPPPVPQGQAAPPPVASGPQGPPPVPQGAPPSGPAPSGPPSEVDQTRADLSRIRKAQDANEASKPELHTSWAQRLALAVLSATKLAPYAQQIVHPKFSEQMGAYENTSQHLQTQLGNAEKAENIAGQNEQRAAVAQQRQAQAANYPAQLAEKVAKDQALQAEAQTKQKELRVADLTKQYSQMFKGREQDVQTLPENDPNLPALQAQGYTILDDGRYDKTPNGPGMKMAIPPAFVQVSPETLPWSFGHKVGDIVPWSEAKENRLNYFKQQQELQMEAAKAQFNQGHQATPEQAFMQEYQHLHPGASIAEGQHAFMLNSQRPPEQAPPQALMIGPDGRAMAVRPGSVVPQGSQTPAGVNQASTPTAQSRSMAEMAGTVTAQVPALLSQIDSLKAKIGPAAGRWNSLWVNRAGMNDPDFAGLDQDLDLFAAALVRTHFGGRGGQGYREALKKDFSMAQSPEDLKARIQHADKWLEGYKQIGGAKGGAGTPGAVSSGPPAVVKWGRDAQGNPVRLP